MPVRMNLDKAEVWAAINFGARRNIHSYTLGCGQTYGSLHPHINGWQVNIMGCMGELALAKYIGEYYNSSLGDYQAADVGNFLQVRATPLCYDNGCLTIHEEDNPDAPFVLARTGIGGVELSGWMWARDAQKPQYWSDKWNKNRPAFFIQHDNPLIQPMETLPRRQR